MHSGKIVPGSFSHSEQTYQVYGHHVDRQDSVLQNVRHDGEDMAMETQKGSMECLAIHGDGWCSLWSPYSLFSK